MVADSQDRLFQQDLLQDLLTKAYADFNARDIDAVLVVVHYCGLGKWYDRYLNGALIADQMVQHVYTIENGLLR